MTADRFRMGELHEEFLAALIGGRKTKASGSQWTDQGDARASHMTDYMAFCADGKSTRGGSIAITREMIAKICEQADAERPMIGIRFYNTDDLKEIGADWVAITADDFAELRALADAGFQALAIQAQAEETMREAQEMKRAYVAPPPAESAHGRPAAAPAADLGQAIQYRPPQQMWPCTLVDISHAPNGEPGGQRVVRCFHIRGDGLMEPFTANQVIIEPDGIRGERLMIDGVLQRSAEVRLDGIVRLRVPQPASYHPVTPADEALRNAGARQVQP